MLGLFLRLAISMGVVMAVMYVAARFARRRQGGAGPRKARARGLAGAGPRYPQALGARGGLDNRGGGAFAGMWRFGRARPDPAEPPAQVVYRLPLAKGAWAVVLAAGGKRLLVGVTEQRVELIAELPSAFSDAPAETAQAFGHESTEEKDIWSEVGTTLTSISSPPEDGRPANAWKLALDSLRERTVRRPAPLRAELRGAPCESSSA